MEFAEVGIGAVTLSGARPLQPWGQDVEVLSAFPGSDDHSTKGSRAEAGAARDGSLVQGLGEFCFPSGANLSLVRAERVREGGHFFLEMGAVGSNFGR